MTQVNIADAEKNLAELIQLLKSGAEDKIILTQDDEAVAKLLPEDMPSKKCRKIRYFGMAKDDIELPPNFDELFDAMDAEIAEMFDDDEDWGFNTDSEATK